MRDPSPAPPLLLPRHARWRGRLRRRKALRWAGRGLSLALALAVLVVLVRQGRRIDWPAVGQSLAAMPAGVLLTAAALALASHLLYGGFDLLGRRYTGHHLPRRQVLLVGTTSYAFNLNLGSVLGGVACRARLYARLGLPGGRIARVVMFSLMSNWLGYMLLAGALFSVSPPSLPPAWGLQALTGGGLRGVGLGLLALGLLYLGLCARHGGQVLRLRQQNWEVPRLGLALGQVLLSTAHWSVMGAVLAVLFQGGIAYPQVLAVLLVAAVAGVLAHVPAGLGVLEAVFVALLAHQLPTASLLAGLVMYRALFYLLPLAVGVVVFLRMESTAARRP